MAKRRKPRPDWTITPYPAKRLLFSPTTVTKWYPRWIRHRLADEIAAYRSCAWAAPRLLWATKEAICVERCTPMLDIPPEAAHALALRELLEKLHAQGWNHRDVSVANTVLHPRRGVLLIDWECAGPVDPLSSSYDLLGAAAAGYPEDLIPPHQRPNGVWWGGPGLHAPANHWGEIGADLGS